MDELPREFLKKRTISQEDSLLNFPRTANMSCPEIEYKDDAEHSASEHEDDIEELDEEEENDAETHIGKKKKVLRGSVPKPSPPHLDYATTPLSAIMPPLPPQTKGGFSNPSTYTSNCPVTIIKRRSQFEDWLLEHKQHGGCRFYRRTAGLSSARNVIFLEKFGSHQSADSYVAPPEPKRPAGAKRGRPTTISFIETYLCHHHGKPQPSDEEEMNLPRRLFKNMYPCKCPAKIVVKSSEKDPTMVSIWYYWKHDGHPVCQ
ncbi:hypothetical protein DM01DRAFT_1411311 [Hesseltinella vesiculosa]|uniref:Uncharacterized protein n=1 Tax=Hesseltinella vesiculosa TaxID=101127 RepID=A0A1X2G457_9FUNG|nr:hypothetical protein DM01DRAFT_1411311 [Hesseltinella vesiculosa]